MSARNTTTTLAAIKLGIFTMASLLVTGTLAVIMGNFSFGAQHTYHAVFTSASMIKKGDDVRIAGVTVGEVKKVVIFGRNQAKVTFKVEGDVPMTTSSRAEVRFLNLVGKRYMSLSEGSGSGGKLPDGGTIPVSQTQPALNLTELFNGFQPLFQALNPDEVNQLSMNLIRVLQGEGGTIASLMKNTASLTNTLADRDQLIGDVIENLSEMLQVVDDRHDQLNQLLIELKGWMTNLARDRKQFGGSLDNISGLTAELADLLTQGREPLKQDIVQLRRVLNILNKKENQKILDEVLNRLPVMLERQARIGTYGSWYNYYLCDFRAVVTLPDLPLLQPLFDAVPQLKKTLSNLEFYSTATRCK